MKKIASKFLATLPYIIVFTASLYQPSDPDLGWHLKYGEYFFHHGSVLRDNTFAVLMPNFHWANVSWGTDVITYAAYAVGGFLGLTILSALIVSLTFFFFSRAAGLSLWDEAVLFPLLLYLERPLNLISLRGQQISMLMLGIMVYLIGLSEKKPKVLYLLIPFFFIWVNLHGQFFLGLAFLGLWIFLTLCQKFFFVYNKDFKKTLVDAKKLGIIFLLSFLATLLNPFGIGVHLDALAHIGTPLLKNIAEYLPFDMLSKPWWNQVIVATLLALGLIFLYFKGKLASKIPLLGGIVLLYLLSFQVRRYAWSAYYLILPILQPLSSMFKPDKPKTTFIVSSLLLATLFALAFVEKYPFTNFTRYSWDMYCQYSHTSCSSKSAEFLIEHKLTNNLYSLYGWGGWLIWNYPQIKPTIDGRMHIWRDEKGYSGFEDYYGYEQNLKDIDTSKYDVVYMSPDKPIYDHMVELVKKDKWKLVYQDDFAGIFVRKK